MKLNINKMSIIFPKDVLNIIAEKIADNEKIQELDAVNRKYITIINHMVCKSNIYITIRNCMEKGCDAYSIEYDYRCRYMFNCTTHNVSWCDKHIDKCACVSVPNSICRAPLEKKQATPSHRHEDDIIYLDEAGICSGGV